MSGESSVRVLERACSVLDCFTVEEPRLTIAEIRARTQLPATTVSRILKTLVEQGLVAREVDEYLIGLRVLVWGAPARTARDLITTAEPVVRWVRDLSGETARLLVREGASHVVVAAAQGRHSVSYTGRVGDVGPLYSGAPGKAFMAFDAAAFEAAVDEGIAALTPHTVLDPARLSTDLDAVRRRGWARSASETEVGVNAVAAPVLDAMQRPVAVLAVSGPSFRLDDRAVEALGPHLVDQARGLAERLGHVGSVGRVVADGLSAG